MEALKDERAALDDQIAAEAARKKFAERFANETPFGVGEKGETRGRSPNGARRSALSRKRSAAADDAIREAKLKQREIDGRLARLDRSAARPTRRARWKCASTLRRTPRARATFRVSYTVRGARWAPLYDARLDTGTRERKPALELVRRAEIVQQTGEDWSDVALSVSTVRTAKGGSAPELRPLIVRYPDPMRNAAAPDRAAGSDRLRVATQQYWRNAGRPNRSPAPAAPASEREAAIETGGFQAVFRIPGRISVAGERRRQELPHRDRHDRAGTAGARDAGARRDRLPRSLLQADRGGAAAARPRRALSRRHLRRARPDGADPEGRDRAARLRRRRQGQGRARDRAQDRGLGRHHLVGPRPTSASTRSPCAAVTTRRSRSWSRTRSR